MRALGDGAERLLPNTAVRTIAGPALYWLMPVFYARAAGASLLTYAAAYAAYLFVPAIILLADRGRRAPRAAATIAAAIAFWLPLEFDLLPPLRLSWPVRVDASLLLGLVTAFYLFLIGRPLDGIGYTYALRAREVAVACAAVLVYAVVALPIGLASGFLAWNPRISAEALLVTPLLIFLATGIPEEFLFRGLLQNAFRTWFGVWGALALASVVFGLAHLPDGRYVALAALAGVAYGWVYIQTRKVTAAAITHAGVDWLWVLLLRAP